jgi:putative ABC transport system ATP-binding protein
MILEMSNIYKNYIQGNMEVPVLKDINFSVEEGEYVAIMGPSGSGKSTLMNIIGCLDQATSGTYLLDGRAIENYSDKELARVRNEYIGFVFQTFNLLPKQSALENVALPLQYAGVPKRYRKERCIEALSMVGLEDRVYFKPTQLSGGQKQRVAIARAMINDPKILLADEPTGALDSKSGVQVMELFSQLHKQGKTIIMITHSDEIASHAERVIRIIDGEIYENGSGNPELVGGMADGEVTA